MERKCKKTMLVCASKISHAMIVSAFVTIVLYISDCAEYAMKAFILTIVLLILTVINFILLTNLDNSKDYDKEP